MIVASVGLLFYSCLSATALRTAVVRCAQRYEPLTDYEMAKHTHASSGGGGGGISIGSGPQRARKSGATSSGSGSSSSKSGSGSSCGSSGGLGGSGGGGGRAHFSAAASAAAAAATAAAAEATRSAQLLARGALATSLPDGLLIGTACVENHTISHKHTEQKRKTVLHGFSPPDSCCCS